MCCVCFYQQQRDLDTGHRTAIVLNIVPHHPRWTGRSIITRDRKKELSWASFVIIFADKHRQARARLEILIRRSCAAQCFQCKWQSDIVVKRRSADTKTRTLQQRDWVDGKISCIHGRVLCHVAVWRIEIIIPDKSRHCGYSSWATWTANKRNSRYALPPLALTMFLHCFPFIWSNTDSMISLNISKAIAGHTAHTTHFTSSIVARSHVYKSNGFVSFSH